MCHFCLMVRYFLIYIWFFMCIWWLFHPCSSHFRSHFHSTTVLSTIIACTIVRNANCSIYGLVTLVSTCRNRKGYNPKRSLSKITNRIWTILQRHCLCTNYLSHIVILCFNDCTLHFIARTQSYVDKFYKIKT